MEGFKFSYSLITLENFISIVGILSSASNYSSSIYSNYCIYDYLYFAYELLGTTYNQ